MPPFSFVFSVGCLLKRIAFLVALLFLAAPAFAYDFGTAGIVGGLAVAGAALALTFGAPAALGTIALSAVVAGITFNPEHSETESGTVDVQLSPGAQLATPEGWTAPAPGQVEPVPPSSAAAVEKYRVYEGQTFRDTKSAACAEYGAASGNLWRLADVNHNHTTNEALAYYCNVSFNGGATWTGFVEFVTTSACPAGYTLSGSSCVLSDASQVPKPSDGRCTIKRVGNSFSADPRDPDCASGKIPATTSVQPNVISSTNSDGSSKSITINGDGSSTVTESRPNNSNNTTETNTTTFSAPDASGAVKVTGQGSGVAPGTGTQAGTSGAPVIFDKTGLATEGTLSGIKGDTGAIRDALTGEGADSSLSAEKSAFAAALDGLVGMFGDEQGRSSGGFDEGFDFGGYLPSQCGCSPLTVTFHGHTASYDWCEPMNTFKGVMAWVFGILTAFYVLSLFRLGGSR